MIHAAAQPAGTPLPKFAYALWIVITIVLSFRIWPELRPLT